jgi:predicted Zn-dependent protease with MMP-like domain
MKKKIERLSADRFHALAEAELAAIPKPLRDLLVNVAIEVKDSPGIEAEDLEDADELLGLYTGPTREEMLSADANGVLPAKIYLYQRAVENSTSSLAALKKELRLTLRHELAHHFGFDDEELERVWPEGA